MPGHIQQIGSVHPHLTPHPSIGYRGGQAVFSRISYKVADGSAVVVEVVALDLEQPVDAIGVDVGPIGQQQHVLAIGMMALAALRLYDDWAIQADLLLEAGVSVIPVGT